eukprot:g39692.t1
MLAGLEIGLRDHGRTKEAASLGGLVTALTSDLDKSGDSSIELALRMFYDPALTAFCEKEFNRFITFDRRNFFISPTLEYKSEKGLKLSNVLVKFTIGGPLKGIRRLSGTLHRGGEEDRVTAILPMGHPKDITHSQHQSSESPSEPASPVMPQEPVHPQSSASVE